jgi:hypothetical protein
VNKFRDAIPDKAAVPAIKEEIRMSEKNYEHFTCKFPS